MLNRVHRWLRLARFRRGAGDRRWAVPLRGVLVAALLWGCGDSPGIEEAFLWRVDVASEPTYLLGTIHFGVHAEDLPPVVRDAFEGSHTFVAESDVATPPTDEEIERASTLPQDVVLEELLPPLAWERLTYVLSETSLEVLQRTHPWFVEAFLAQTLLPEWEAMDETFTRRAREAGKTVAFLETFADFAGTIEQLPLEQSALGLTQLLYDPRGYEAAVYGLVDVYSSGDAQAVRSLIFAGEGDSSGSAVDPILEGRNKKWFSALKEHVQRGGAFIAVGLAHLIGPDNLLDMFRLEGITATRIGSATDVSVGSSAAALAGAGNGSPPIGVRPGSL